MDPQRWMLFVAAAGALIAVPGPDWAFTVAVASQGRHVPAAVLGLSAGYLGLTVLVAAGTGAAVARSPLALTVLTLVGAVYLGWLGIRLAVRPARAAPERAGGPGDRGPFVQGLAVSALNPKGVLLMVAVLPQFADPREVWPLPVQLGALGLTFTAACAAFYLVLGASARRLSAARPAGATVVTRLAGVAMIGLAVVLLLERAYAETG